jgi:hypothetical protein
MNVDPANLDNLRDLVQLPPVSWWPLAPGWWALLVVAIGILIGMACLVWRRWRARAYRRAALGELQSATDMTAIAEILKRTALVAYPRTDVASLSGLAWAEWLAESGGRQVPAAVAQSLSRGVFARRRAADLRELTTFAAEWIKNHVTEKDRKHPRARNEGR